MFAVLKSGGKQYKVKKNDVIRVEKLDAETGANISIVQILIIGHDTGQTIGVPYIENASVSATVLEQIRDQKVIVFKKKRRQNYRRRKGHRQALTVLRIDDIVSGDKKKKSAKKKENTAKTPNPTNSAVAKENTRKKASKKITSGSEVSAKTEEKE